MSILSKIGQISAVLFFNIFSSVRIRAIGIFPLSLTKHLSGEVGITVNDTTQKPDRKAVEIDIEAGFQTDFPNPLQIFTK
uniref:Uncharacterized protein n=1 Tax=Cyanophora sudae TaxID=1522369 RepID=A0A2Z4HG04_9EUKA|nr:hypothetical protein [Cyanophora sudae]AWW13717.1 hypothetical protein [Cyanophora sudae]